VSLPFCGLQLLCFDECTEPVEAGLPELSAFAQPLLNPQNRLTRYATRSRTADLFGRDEPADLQHLDMLDDRGERGIEGIRKLRDGGWALGESIEQCTACRVRQGMKGAIEGGVTMLKHVL
jgi:hypothetical protein